jgi:hypothetical protein
VNEHLLNRIAGVVVHRMKEAEDERRSQANRFWLTLAAGAILGVVFTWKLLSLVYRL